MADLLAQYEEYLAAEKHASQNTLSSYMRDLHQLPCIWTSSTPCRCRR